MDLKEVSTKESFRLWGRKNEIIYIEPVEFFDRLNMPTDQRFKIGITPMSHTDLMRVQKAEKTIIAKLAYELERLGASYQDFLSWQDPAKEVEVEELEKRIAVCKQVDTTDERLEMKTLHDELLAKYCKSALWANGETDEFTGDADELHPWLAQWIMSEIINHSSIRASDVLGL